MAKPKFTKICPGCSSQFSCGYPSEFKRKKYCTKTCSNIHRPQPSAKERLWEKVDRSGDCWIWKGAISNKGYGSFRFNNKTELAHRVAWILVNGPIPDGVGDHGTCVLHSCDNPRCVNPAHLFLGTQVDNINDMVRKGRGTMITTFCVSHEKPAEIPQQVSFL